ncbi:alpha/beta fold hydrolase [Pseudonocardia pini]|uniref:alpha/beta fold hydrolase n=1 Tax=Pseudonocardia pini TaxID=2758030 RepID=UPI0015F0441D|nr:alpha/beta hydrolase [Pseudonocardia pini]
MTGPVGALSGLAAMPLVGVPGLGLSAATLRPSFRAAGAAGGATVVTLPGFGRPAPRRSAVDPPVQATRLLDRIGELGIGPCVLVGHSAGCQVVAEVAALAPGVVAALVLIGPTTDPRARTRSRLAARWLRTTVHEPAAQAPLLVRDYTRTGPVAMARTMGAARRHRIENPLLVVSCPVLVLRGPRDRIAPADWIATLARITAHGTAVTLAKGAHMVPLTEPDDVGAAISSFLTRAVHRAT